MVAHSADPSELFLKPYWLLWYLLSLIFWRIISQAIPSDGNRTGVILLSFLLGLGAGFLPLGYELSLSRTFVYLPFFMMGLLASPAEVEKIRAFPKLPAIGILCGLFVWLCLHRDNFSFVLSGSRSYAEMSPSVWLSLLYRAAFYLAAVASSVAVLSLVRNSAFWSKIGQKSLYIFIYHGFAVHISGMVFAYLRIDVGFVLLFCCAALIVAAIYCMSRWRILTFLLHPVSSLVGYVRS